MKIIILVCTRNIAHGGGMDRVIHHSLGELNKRFEKVIIVSGSNFADLVIGFIKILKENPFSFDYFIFNSLGSFRSRYNKYWTYYYYFVSFFNIRKVLYWHEMPEYYRRFKQDAATSKEVELIEKRFKKKKLLQLCCSVENSKIAYFFDSNPNYRIINNCIKPRIFRKSFLQSKFTVITVGSVQLLKGTDIWLEVAINVCKQNAKIQFVWCGGAADPILFDHCVKKVNDIGLQEQILFLGHVEDASVLTSAAHLYFASSRMDSFPLAILEAMSFGKNIIYYNSGGISEAVGEFGTYIEDFSVVKSAEKIVSFYEAFEKQSDSIFNRDLYDRFYENYTPEIFVQKLKDSLYES